MQEKKLERALSWAGAGGAAVASSMLLTAALVAATPDGVSPLSELQPCFSAGCTTVDGSVTAADHVRSLRRPAAVPKPERATPTVAPKPPAAKVTTARRPVPAPAAPKWTTDLPNQHLAAPIVAATSVGQGSEPLMVGSDGGVFPLGAAGFFGSLGGRPLSGRIAAVASNPLTGGYWLAGSDGGVFAFYAPYYGGAAGHHMASPVAAMASTPTGKGYWLAARDGGVFAYGDAPFRGSLARTRLASPVVAMASTPTGKGYWLAARDGGVFAFGDAGFYGGLSRASLRSPVVAMAAAPDGKGYWLVSADGGVFAFGSAPFRGGASRQRLPFPVQAIVATATGKGYWLIGAQGAVYAYGDARPVGVVPADTTVDVTTSADSASSPGPVAGAAVAPPPGPGRPGAGRPAAPAARSARPSPPVPGAAGSADRSEVRGAYSSYRGGRTGYDISQYQCSSIPADHTSIAVVQLTGGALDTPPNPCYVQEAHWAGRNLAAYIYMDGFPTSGAPAWTRHGPAGNCAATNVACESYNYGYWWVIRWVNYSRSVGVDPWMYWLDVERYSGWQDTISNQLVIRGALQALGDMHETPGIYSSAAQWSEITGDMAIPRMPVWVPGAGNLTGPGYSAKSFCRTPGKYSFGGGTLKIVQYGYQGPFPGSYSGPPQPYDMDYTCR